MFSGSAQTGNIHLPVKQGKTQKKCKGQHPLKFPEGFPVHEVTDSILLQPLPVNSPRGNADSGYWEEVNLYAPRTYAECWYLRPRLEYPETII
jgi:hypothetical protein